MISEMSRQLPAKPDAIICSVGGGGLLGGVIDGCKTVAWDDGTNFQQGRSSAKIKRGLSVPVVAVETHGAAAFYHSISINARNWNAKTALPHESQESYDQEANVRIVSVRITSKATSLAATSPSASVVRAALLRKADTICVTIPDEMAMSTACLFAGKRSFSKHRVCLVTIFKEDHKILAELACSTTLSLAYHPDLFMRIRETYFVRGDGNMGRKNVVFIVCGGVKISAGEIHEYENELQELLRQGEKAWEVFCNGERWDIEPRTMK